MSVLFLAPSVPVNLGIILLNNNRMKSTKHLNLTGYASPEETNREGLLTLLSILLGEIVIIDVMGL